MSGSREQARIYVAAANFAIVRRGQCAANIIRSLCAMLAPTVPHIPLEERGYVAGRSSAIGESLYRTCFNFRRRVPAGCMVADGVGHDGGRIRQLYFFDLKGAPEEFQIQRNTELVPACRCPH